MEIIQAIDGVMIFVWATVAVVFIMMESSRFWGDHFSFAVGALGAIACWVAGLGLIVEVIAFAVLSAFSWLVLRPLFVKLVTKSEEDKLDDSWIGRTAVVTIKVDINVEENNGRVRIDDHELRARAKDPKQKYNIGDRVKVVGVDGNCLVVTK